MILFRIQKQELHGILSNVTIIIIGDNTDTCQQGIWSDLILEITPSQSNGTFIRYRLLNNYFAYSTNLIHYS